MSLVKKKTRADVPLQMCYSLGNTVQLITRMCNKGQGAHRGILFGLSEYRCIQPLVLWPKPDLRSPLPLHYLILFCVSQHIWLNAFVQKQALLIHRPHLNLRSSWAQLTNQILYSVPMYFLVLWETPPSKTERHVLEFSSVSSETPPINITQNLRIIRVTLTACNQGPFAKLTNSR